MRRKKLVAALLLAGLAGLALASQAAEHARAEEIVSGKCFICHGAEGENSTPAFPRLAGQHARYVAKQLADYKSGRRQNSAMRAMVEDLSAADFDALGRFFETRPVQVHLVEDAHLASAGQGLFLRGNSAAGVPACASCHGESGQGTATLPRLAGQHAQYTERQLKAFNQRERTNDNAVMHAVAVKLSDLERKALAAYISGLK